MASRNIRVYWGRAHLTWDQYQVEHPGNPFWHWKGNVWADEEAKKATKSLSELNISDHRVSRLNEIDRRQYRVLQRLVSAVKLCFQEEVSEFLGPQFRPAEATREELISNFSLTHPVHCWDDKDGCRRCWLKISKHWSKQTVLDTVHVGCFAAPQQLYEIAIDFMFLLCWGRQVQSLQKGGKNQSNLVINWMDGEDRVQVEGRFR